MKTRSLRSQPRVAREIGYLVMHASNLEVMFVSILTALLDDDPTLPVSIATQVDNITAKLDVMFDVAESKPKDKLAKAVSRAKDDVKKAMAFRNKLAHSHLFLTKKQGILN